MPHWYDPVVKFWKNQISVTIDEGAHRDHLGMLMPIFFEETRMDCGGKRLTLEQRTSAPSSATYAPPSPSL